MRVPRHTFETGYYGWIVDNRSGEMLVFVRVVEEGSFSEAARRLHTAPSTVSKLIARLEHRLGVRLLERSTRRLVLTTEGQVYFERSQALLAELDDVERRLTEGGRRTGGIVRVNTSVSFGRRALEPLLPAFWQDYPNIVVDLSLSDEIVDLYLDRTDVAFRVGQLQSSSLIARKVGNSRRVIVGSPAYLERHGAPTSAEDLARHNCLGFNFRRAAPVWPLKEGGRIVDRMIHGSLLANNGETVGRMVLAGVGLGRLGDYHVRDYIARGEMVEVLGGSEISDSEEIHALYIGTQRMPERVRAFLDFVVPQLQTYLAGG
jgi:DNA-binding transcriptional LysR family regulator